MSENGTAANSTESKQLRVECALEAVLDLFTPMLDKWRMGTPISKLCYGLNNEHMKALEELDSLIKYGRP